MFGVGFLVWFIILILNIVVAKRNNRSILAWIILSIFFSFIALIVNICLRPAAPRR